VYDRQVTPEQALTFGVSGMLYRNGLIMFDRQTNSLWSHILGQAISGDYEGTQLTFIPALQTDWQSWLELHPDTLVINPEFVGSDTYTNYYLSNREGVIGWSNPDDRLLSKEYVIGVRLGGQARAYPFSVLGRQPVVNDQIADINVAVFFDKATTSGTVFDRQLEDGTLLTFEAGPDSRLAIDMETQSEWDILTGTAVSGSLGGTQLTQVPITYAFWFGWTDYHGEGTVYTLEE
jgi:hypothetical protein